MFKLQPQGAAAGCQPGVELGKRAETLLLGIDPYPATRLLDGLLNRCDDHAWGGAHPFPGPASVGAQMALACHRRWRRWYCGALASLSHFLMVLRDRLVRRLVS